MSRSTREIYYSGLCLANNDAPRVENANKTAIPSAAEEQSSIRDDSRFLRDFRDRFGVTGEPLIEANRLF